MRPHLIAVLGSALALAACGPTSGDDATNADGGRDAAVRDDGGGLLTDAPSGNADVVPGFVGAVYAHSSSDLYKIDPDTLAVTHVAAFAFPGSDEMTDIALDATANMVGISYDTVYAVNKDTGACTRLAALDRRFNGLSFVPGDEITGGQEILVGAALDGTVYRIDKTTGQSSRIGNYAGGMTSSGDLVSVTGFGTVATVKKGLGGTDWLARVDPNTGVATPIGDTGQTDIWGLGYWKGKVFGFTEGGRFVLINVQTGAATVQPNGGGIAWWGAGVTTSAPTID
ncbi:MAG TPA: hypothetical protein VGQ83_00825 [Polyangia bacterium]|jgi:hypothetical protein